MNAKLSFYLIQFLKNELANCSSEDNGERGDEIESLLQQLESLPAQTVKPLNAISELMLFRVSELREYVDSGKEIPARAVFDEIELLKGWAVILANKP